MNSLISDIEYFEGFIGAFGTLISFIFFRNILQLNNLGIIMSLSFFTTWLLRRICVSLYKELKYNGHKYDFDVFNMRIKGTNLYTQLIILCSIIFAYFTSKKKISYVSIIMYLFFIINFYTYIMR